MYKKLILTFVFIYSYSICFAEDIKLSVEKKSTKTYKEKFLELYQEIYDPSNGYISKEGIPYHSIEKLIIEAHDYGYHSTSEAMSFLIWLDVLYAYFTGDWKPFEKSWEVMEKYFIPDKKQNNKIWMRIILINLLRMFLSMKMFTNSQRRLFLMNQLAWILLMMLQQNMDIKCI